RDKQDGSHGCLLLPGFGVVGVGGLGFGTACCIRVSILVLTLAMSLCRADRMSLMAWVRVARVSAISLVAPATSSAAALRSCFNAAISDLMPPSERRSRRFKAMST